MKTKLDLKNLPDDGFGHFESAFRDWFDDYPWHPILQLGIDLGRNMGLNRLQCLDAVCNVMNVAIDSAIKQGVDISVTLPKDND